ncbi:MAG TPA: M14 family metallocarboxypeptidase [Opitutaceae bacterium]|nr:M14 family metallocarboxypeptidase [Opitutaceae bacterium]
MQPVKASEIDPHALSKTFQELAPKRGFRVEEFGRVAGFPLIALTKRTPGVRPRIYLSGGIHGDEPAGPMTLLQLLQDDFFAAQANWFICPMLNPVGLARGIRENADGIDLNRDYRNTPKSAEIRAHVAWLARQPRFDAALCLHEDWEFPGFYVFELNYKNRRSIAEALIEDVSKVCSIELREIIDEREAKQGIIRPSIGPAEREQWPEAIYLSEHHTDLCFTTESPSSQPMPMRVAAQSAAIGVVVRETEEERRSEK